MIFYLLASFILGMLVIWIFYFSARRELVALEEQKQVIEQEKHIVIDFMHSLVMAIGEGVQKEQLYHKIVHTAILSTGGLSACLFEHTAHGALRSVASEGLFPPQKTPSREIRQSQTRVQMLEKVLQSEVFNWGEGLIGSVAKTGKAILIKDAQADPRVIQHEDPTLAIGSMIVAPILFRDYLLGVLAVTSPVEAIAFNENDFSLLESLAEQAGMAIHNLHLMTLMIEKKNLDFDLALASNVQKMLLPTKFPKSDTIGIAAMYQAAQKVGGDFYDVFSLSETKIGVIVADVSGKGISASILMAMIQTHIKHFCRQFDNPAEVLKALNHQIVEETPAEMFVTLIYAIIDTEAKTFTLARAGHEKPLLLRLAEGAYVPLDIETPGMALGIFPNVIFDKTIQNVCLPYNNQDILVLYTDGLTESTNPQGEEFGTNRFVEALLSVAELEPLKMNKGLMKQLEAFTQHSHYGDDLTLLTLKVLR